MIEIDDLYSVIVYHKVESITNAQAPVKSKWGDGYSNVEMANMSMIVIAFRDQVRKSPQFLEAAIKDKMLETVRVETQKAFLRPGTSSFDKLGILSREYLNASLQLDFPQLIIFELKYLIQSTYARGCFESCSEC